MISKEQIQKFKRAANFDVLQRIIAEAFNAAQNAGQPQIIVPVNMDDEGGIELAVVEVEEETLRNLSEEWADKHGN